MHTGRLLARVNASLSVQRQQQRRRQHALLKKLMCLIRMRIYITTAALTSNAVCAWTFMYKSWCEKSFINTVFLLPHTYDMLLEAFSRHYVVKSGPSQRSRPRRFVSKNNVLACLMHMYTAAVKLKTLCVLFGVPPSTMSRTLCQAEVALAASLREIPLAAVQWPSS
ncbi:hypothetical protein PHYSODRAFT_473447 [Phytophthora sojae]|uniref:DDE Tnp4 domain-containing protein n=1 Tax=Phytophthora sojae (strain P6497) TaxID=1094619 RepID=G4YGM0_PHYSP|nr:hypothetical protein PHYSODRAFT_473447 [Phytophthora sojae]EGZ26554.1 hypothetical protein PHYSODRAFT_473447 [Phytophthora sojae]|eukprot:XP_009513829.1 hypothetical protein PHYSODRAFT_473447 [Phytophthora sojae]